MDWGNQSGLTEFVFLAYPSCPELRMLSFFGISLAYAWVIAGNVLILVSVRAEARLHTPMYYFLGSLSGVEICYTAAVVPHILATTLRSDKSITLLGCAVQMTFFIGLGSADCLLLGAMAYDRYVAICHPLRYPLVMTLTLCVRLVVASGILGFSLSLQLVAFIFSLPFCHARGIEHFFCDVPPVMQLVCASGPFHEQSVLAAATLAVAAPFFLITASYARILATVLRVPSAAGRGRAFSTCSSHLTVVLLQYGCCAFMYLRPSRSYHAGQDQLVSLLYTLATPLLNPLIYTLRNREMKGAVGKVLSRSCVTHSPAGHHPAGWGSAAATAHLREARDALS